jgi:hypothetical protein
VRREYDFPRDWRRVSVKKRQIEFAWGPAGPGPLPKTIDAIEIVVTAGTGGKGTVWIDDVQITPLVTATGPPPDTAVPVDGVADLGARYEIGGVVIDTRVAMIATSIDGREWDEHTVDGATWIPLHDTDARFIRIGGRASGPPLPGILPGSKAPDETSGASGRDARPPRLRILPPHRSDNEFFATMARDFRRGLFPRYLLGEQSYWTVIGGTGGEEEEALISEDGAIEAGNARFSIEPFLRMNEKIITWNDVSVEQQEGPRVVWKKHLTITPRLEGGTLKVRYETAANAQLLLAIRPFQVNPPWQFLNRTGGVVRIRSITVERNAITVEADAVKRIAYQSGGVAAALQTPEASVAGDYKSIVLAFDARDVTIELDLGKALSTRHSALSNFSLDVPAEPRIAKTIQAQLDHILINRDGPAIHPGSRSYERSWIRDGSLTSAALLRLGQDAVVREFIEWYAQYIRDDGYVPCCVGAAGADPVPEHDSHGQFIYLVAEYYRHTGDRALVEKMWPSIERIVAFIDKLRHERMTKQYEGTAFYGLVPESISHEGYSAKAMHSYWDDLFVLKGLEDAAFLAEMAGRRAAGTRYAQLATELARDLTTSITRTIRDHAIDYIPGSVELGDFDATSTTVAVTPVDADLPREPLLRTFDKYWERALEPRDYTPYELRTVGTLVRLGQAERARRLLAYFFDDQRPAAWHQWAEVVRANPREGGFVGDMPHTWVGSDFIRSALDFFAYEDDDALILAAGIAPEWAREGVRVRGLSTHFGVLDYSIDDRRMHIGGDLRVPRNGIVVRSPFGGADVVVRSVPAEITLPVSSHTPSSAFGTFSPASGGEGSRRGRSSKEGS